jgi:hypothetical protein
VASRFVVGACQPPSLAVLEREAVSALGDRAAESVCDRSPPLGHLKNGLLSRGLHLPINNCSPSVVVETSNHVWPLHQPMVIRKFFLAWGRSQNGVSALVIDNNCSLIEVMETRICFTNLLQTLNISRHFGEKRRGDGSSVFVTRPPNFQRPILLRY